MSQMLRIDARENRDRVLGAARALFAEQGIGVTMRAVAERAGVGPATLYRRFPTRQALVDAAFSVELAACRAAVEGGAAERDPWHGLSSAVVRLAALAARNRGFTEAMTAADPGAEALREHRAELLRILADLMSRAQRDSALRTDVTVADLVLVLFAARAVPSMPAADREAVARRAATLALDGFRASEANTTLPAVPPRSR